MVSFAAPPGICIASSPAPESIIKNRRPTMGLKRDSSHLDTEDDAYLSNSSKRLRVAFDDRVDVRIMDDWTEKSFELVKEEVRIAIDRHLAPRGENDDLQYSKILQNLSQEAFSADAMPTKLLRRYILAFTSHIPSLGACGKLVGALLDLSWLGRSDDFVEVYIKFLVVLASTHTRFISAVMERLVSNFERLPALTGRLPGEDPILRVDMFDRLHGCIENLLYQIPSASIVLMRVLKHQFPNDLATVKGHLQYQRHLLRVAEAAPELKTEIVALVVQRLVAIDVQIQTDLEELEDDEEEKLLQGPREMHAEESDESDIDSISESEMTITEEEQRLRELRVKVAKMDGTQDLLFDHYDPAFRVEMRPEENVAYQELISHFSSFIIPNRSRHAQFLLFHFSQCSPAYANDFVQHCLRMTLDRNVTITTRLTASAYVASFTARGAHVPADVVRSVFSLLCQYLEEMRRRYEPTCTGPDRKSYSIYYAVAQALLYIFCFRWRDLVVGTTTSAFEREHSHEEDILAEGHDLSWLPGIKDTLTTNVNSVLNPLKVCSTAIVSEFAKIANHLRFLYVFSLLERNKRIRLGRTLTSRMGTTVDLGQRGTALDRKSGDVHHQLAPYFPFDPYHLPRSKRWLQGEYNEWKLPRGMKADDDDDDEDANISEDDYESDEESIAEELTGHAIGQVNAISIND